MGHFPGSESSSGSPSMGRLPFSETCSGSPPLGSFLPSESSSGSPSPAHFRHFEAGGGHVSSASCALQAPARDRSPKKLPPKPPRSMRSPRPFSSRMEKAEKASPSDTNQERKMGCSSNEESVEKQQNSSLKIILRWSGKKPGGSDNAAEEKDCGGEAQKGEEEAKLEEDEERVEEEEEEKVEVEEEETFEDLVDKKWNLRPRKPVKKAGAEAGAGKEPQLQEGSSSQKAAAPKKKPAVPKKPKPLKLSITLTRREIEEDLYAMTGTRPSRKPKRRPKQLQNIVNHLSPGFGLQSFSPSSYNARG